MKKTFPFLLLIFQSLVYSQITERKLSEQKWTFSQQGKHEVLPAKVPGVVHTDLFRNKIIPDPFFGDNENQIQWIENENWIYKTSFSVSEKELQNQKTELIFEGLDTFAEVSLNGKNILKADNMFRTWKVDVKKLLKKGENQLEIKFLSASKKGKESATKLPYELPEKERVFVRKAQYHFGWDWGPRFVTAGIWKPIILKFWNSAKIKSVKHSQVLSKGLAQVNFKIDIDVEKSGSYSLKINDSEKSINLKKGMNEINFPIEIKNPKLWWSNGLGESNLYDFKVQLINDRGNIDSKNLKIGLRKIELVQEKDKIGESFYFKINGIPVYAKGANIIPLHSFLPEVKTSDYMNLIKETKFANMNMLRVWGGGIYESDEFYKLCDENGILVWQDFIFACSMYPGDEPFLENVKREVIDQVNRLQNHASLAIWCGNNENDEGWQNWGWQKQFNYSKQDSAKIWNDYVKLFRKVIPKTLDSVSVQKTTYWQSSPKNGWGRKIAFEEGDVHYWGVWWGMEPLEKYSEKTGRFVSEYGFQGMPDLKTFEKFARKEDLNFNSDAVKNHQKNIGGYDKITEYMKRDFPVPQKFEDFIYASQLLQSRAMKIGAESHRMAKPINMGSLFWQLNDVWPVTSWSSVDFYGNRKATQYQFKRSFADVLISVKETENAYQIFAVNDLLKDFKDGLNLDLIDFKGNNLWSVSGICEIKANSSTMIAELKKSDFKKFNLKGSVLKTSFNSEEMKTESLFYFVKPKDLALEKPNLTVRKINDKTIEITSDILAKDVFLNNKNGSLSDNYFDLLPKEKKIITSEEPIDIVEIKTLFDIFVPEKK